MGNQNQQKNVTIEGAHIIFKNFTGRKDQFNSEGDRNFCVILPEDVATQMLADGWNVKYLKPREEGDEPTPYLQVKIRYDVRPPRVVVITTSGRTHYTQDMLETLDFADVETWDIVINGYDWDVNGKKGVKAYLKTLFCVLNEDDIERKYALKGAPADNIPLDIDDV
jgi:hypothetical protein